jgi:hypothetical protein
MRKPFAYAMLMIVFVGCKGQGPQSSPVGTKPGPKPGDKVIIPTAADLWINLDDMRRQRQMLDAGTWKRDDPHVKEIDQSRIGLITPDALVEILEVGDDYVSINALRDSWGEPINKHGYVKRWW